MPSCLSYSPRSFKPPLSARCFPRSPPPSAPPCAACSLPAPASPHSPAFLPPPLPRPVQALSRSPPLRRRFAPPLPRSSSSPPQGRRFAPLRWPLAAGAARGMAAPASATAPPLARPAPGAGHSSPCRHPDTLRGRDPRPGSGWNSLAFARSPPPRPRASAFTRTCALRAKRPA